MRIRQTGQLLVAVLVLIAVIGAMVIAAGFLSVDDTRSATLTVQSGRALHAANSGLEYAAYRMRTDTTAFATTCTNLNNVTQTVATGISSFTLTTTSVAAANTTLPTGITAAAATAITVTSAANFPSHGRMRIDSEEIVYTGKTATTFTGIKRGAAGSTANAHANNAPVASEAQCVVRATGNAGTAARVLESSFVPGPRAAFFDGGLVAIGTGATTLGSVVTQLPSGDNIVIAAVTLQNTNAATNFNAGTLVLRNATTTVSLGQNAILVQVGGTATATNNNRSTKTHFLVARDPGAAANQTYDVRATGSNTNTSGEVKILVINGPRASVGTAIPAGAVTVLPTGGTATTVATLTTTFPGTAAVQNAVNLIVASVQIDATSGNNGRTIAAGGLRLMRGATLIDSNQFQMVFRSNGNVNQEFSHLLVALDSGAPANPTYSVTATPSNNNSFQAEAKIVAMQGPAGIFVDGGSVALGTAATTLGTAATAFPPLVPGANVAVIATTQYVASVNAGGPFSIAAGAENVVYNAANQSINASQHFFCNTNTSNGECDHIGDAMLWLQTFAAGNSRTSSSYAVRSAASAAASVNGETKILVIRLEPIADRIEIF